MPDKTFVSCSHCGSQLHPNASFCPYCGKSVNVRKELVPPALSWRRALRRALPILRFFCCWQRRGRAGTSPPGPRSTTTAARER